MRLGIVDGRAVAVGAAVCLAGVGVWAQQGLSVEKTPVRHHIRASELPPPNATPSADRQPEVVSRPEGAHLYVPPGFRVERWAGDLVNPRWMAVAPNGDLFVAESRANRVSVLRPGRNGGAPERTVFVGGLNQPFGIAFFPAGPNPRAVYIANTDGVLRFPYRNGDLKATGAGSEIMRLPGGGYNQHWTRTIVVRPDSKKLYVAVGSRENLAEEEPPRAAVMECNPDGSGVRVFATGLRNAVGLGFEPVTGKLWAAVNERDRIGDELPPDYATVVKDGGFYGWPYYYAGANHDPRMPEKPQLARKTIVPDVLLDAHCAALSIEFYRGTHFPATYRHQGFVATHGSWNRRNPVGFKVLRVAMKPDGTAQGWYDDFVWGWRTEDGQVWGRPVCAVEARDGSLLISDDGGNCVWRVSYAGKRA